MSRVNQYLYNHKHARLPGNLLLTVSQYQVLRAIRDNHDPGVIQSLVKKGLLNSNLSVTQMGIDYLSVTKEPETFDINKHGRE